MGVEFCRKVGAFVVRSLWLLMEAIDVFTSSTKLTTLTSQSFRNVLADFD